MLSTAFWYLMLLISPSGLPLLVFAKMHLRLALFFHRQIGIFWGILLTTPTKIPISTEMHFTTMYYASPQYPQGCCCIMSCSFPMSIMINFKFYLYVVHLHLCDIFNLPLFVNRTHLTIIRHVQKKLIKLIMQFVAQSNINAPVSPVKPKNMLITEVQTLSNKIVK